MNKRQAKKYVKKRCCLNTYPKGIPPKMMLNIYTDLVRHLSKAIDDTILFGLRGDSSC